MVDSWDLFLLTSFVLRINKEQCDFTNWSSEPSADADQQVGGGNGETRHPEWHWTAEQLWWLFRGPVSFPSVEKGRRKGWCSRPGGFARETLVLFCHCCKEQEPCPKMLLNKGIQIRSKKNQAHFQIAGLLSNTPPAQGSLGQRCLPFPTPLQ